MSISTEGEGFVEVGATSSPGRADARPPSQLGMVHAVPLDGIEAQVAPPGSRLAEAVYRVFEFTAALIGLVVTLPIMIVEGLLIRMDSPGPALFWQRRVARSAVQPGSALSGRFDLVPPPGGFEPQKLYLVPQTFSFVKFRTMHHDAFARWPERYDYRCDPKTFRTRQFKTDDDPRVTRLGLFLRRLTLDELPNLWCVLTGQMALVGPRPEMPAVVGNYLPDDLYKFAVKPGITGLAQINGRGLLSWGETLAWDLEYVRTRSVALDLKILLKTVWYVVIRRGAF